MEPDITRSRETAVSTATSSGSVSVARPTTLDPAVVSNVRVVDAPFNGTLRSTDPTLNPGGTLDQGSALEQVPLDRLDAADELTVPPKARFSRQRLLGISLLVLGVLAASMLGIRIEASKSKNLNTSISSASQRVKPQSTSLTGLSSQLETVPTVSPSNSLTVNGSLVLTPSVQPSSPVAGQLFYNGATNQIQYYDGTGYVKLQGGNAITNNTYNNTTVNNTYGASNTYVTNNISNGASVQGAAGTLAVFGSNGSTLANSLISESGTTLTTTAEALQGNNSQGLNILTANSSGVSGALTVESGSSSTTSSGDVTIDTGSGTVNGTVTENYTFEDGTDGFNASPYFSVPYQSNAAAHSGNDSLAVQLSLAAWSAMSSDQTIPVTPGHEYHWTAWVEAATASAPISAGVYYVNGSAAQPAAIDTTDSVGTWSEISGTFVDPNGTTAIGLYFVYQKNANGEVHYLDDVTVTDLNSFTGLTVNVGTTNAQAVNIGNSNQVGDTTITGGTTGIKINDATGDIDINSGADAIINGTNATRIQGGANGITVVTGNSTGASGGITIQSGNSSTTASGDISLDTGSGFINGEIVGDKTFEDGTDNMIDWFDATLAQSNTEAHGGTESLAVTAGGQFWGVADDDNNLNLNAQVVAGHHYLFVAWVRAGTVGRQIETDLCWNETTCDSVSLPTATDNTTGWTEISGTATAPGGATSVGWNFKSSTSAAGEVHYFDDLTVTDLSSASAVSSLNIGATNAEFVTIGNANEIGATTIDGGSGITLNALAGPINESGGAITIAGTAASSLTTNSGTLTLGAGGGTGGNGVVVTTQANSTSAFSVQGAGGGTTLLNVDTTDSAISLGAGAGASFGNTQLNTANQGTVGNGQIAATRFTTGTTAGAIASMSVWVGAITSNTSFQLAVYSDNAGAPGSYIASSVATALSTSGWYTVPVSTTLSPSTSYWLAYWTNGPSGGNRLALISGGTLYQGPAAWQGGPDNGMPATVATGGMTYTATPSIYATYASNLPALTINGAGTLTQQGAAIFQDPTSSTTALQIQNSLGTSLLTADTADMIITVSGSLTVSGNITVDGHIVTGGTTPTIAAGAAACTSPTVSISGDDTAGTITVTTGTGCSAGGTLATVTFASPFGAAPHVILSPDNAATPSLEDYLNHSTISTTGFSVGAASTPTVSTTYQWDYWVAQ